MSEFITFFGVKLLACLVFTLICFLIAWPIGLLFKYKDKKKMKEILLDQPINRRKYWGMQVIKLSLTIMVLYGISIIASHFFESPLSSVSPFVGILTLLLMLYIKFAPRTTGEVTPYSGDIEVTYVIIDPDAYFNSTGITMIFGSFVFTIFEFGQVLL